MPIVSGDLKCYASANMPENEIGVSGGAIDLTTVILSFPMGAEPVATQPKLQSANTGDTMNITVYGRTPAGELISEVKALTGTSVTTALTNTYERILRMVAASAPAGNVSVLMNNGTTVIAVLPAGKIGSRTLFYDAVSETSEVFRYEKIYWRNEHATLTLNAAVLRITADPSEDANHDMQVGVETGASQSTGNRKTAPSSPSTVTFVDENIDIVITSLAASASKGLWGRQRLGGNASANKSSFTTELAGTTV